MTFKNLTLSSITELTGAGQDATHVARLQARSMFKDIRAEAEEYIYRKLVRSDFKLSNPVID